MSNQDTENLQIIKLSEKFPQSIAYSNPLNPAFSLDQRNLEYKLESLVNSCKSLLKDRNLQFTKQNDSILPTPVVLPDIQRFRSDREFCLRALLQVKFPEPLILDADFLQEEVVSGSIPQIIPTTIYNILLQYFQARKFRIIQRKCNYLVRWAQYCSVSDIIVKQSLNSFILRLDKLDAEYEDTLMRFQRLQNVLIGNFYTPFSETTEEGKTKG
jgi:hypothetical protein